ncbi:hypothetical protein IFM89_009022 [Coptis chinensis]|uniref:Kinesin motor domain-containing protein n=1 Tax=Coptis chinensis TaxID=261450 RepID=A0A835LX68_9MAGN|nr:hypothetical protein IFM89_009022 [Coptis chinensis]
MWEVVACELKTLLAVPEDYTRNFRVELLYGNNVDAYVERHTPARAYNGSLYDYLLGRCIGVGKPMSYNGVTSRTILAFLQMQVFNFLCLTIEGLFWYGQTGTGKTFTMEGIERNRGVKYRTLEELFKNTKERNETFSYSISVSVLEVYNEHIRDLLANSPTSKK